MKLAAPSIDARRLRALARRWRTDAGLPGLLGAVLLGAALWLELMTVPALQGGTLVLQAQAHRVQVQARQPLRLPPTAQDVLSTFYGRLTPRAQRDQALARMLQKAQAQGLTLETIQLHVDDQDRGPIQRQTLTLPVKGSYAQIRGWIADVLHDSDAVSLDNLELRRDDPQTDQLQARLTLSLWMHDGASLQGGAAQTGGTRAAADDHGRSAPGKPLATAHATAASGAPAALGGVVELAQSPRAAGARERWE